VRHQILGIIQKGHAQFPGFAGDYFPTQVKLAELLMSRGLSGFHAGKKVPQAEF
jgi:hypothetical protein